MHQNTAQTMRKKFNLLKFNTKLWLAGTYFTLFKNNRVVLDGVEIIVPQDLTDVKLRGQLQVGFYEREERRHLKKYLNPEACVLELGGCLGVVSCIANKMLQHPKRHIVVEANPALIQHIERNKQHTGGAFTIEHCIVSNKPEVEFFLGDTILGSSARHKSPKKIVVPGKSITQLEDTHQIKFDTLIMDIEGAELDFLRENRDWLRQLNTVFMEIHAHPDYLSDTEVDACKTILEDAGLRLVLVDGLTWVLKRP
jgi:FkbM family methyltransferase